MKTIALTIFSVIWWVAAQAQSQSVRATIRVVGVYSTDASNFNFKFWLNGTQISGCDGSLRSPGAWMPHNYPIITNRSETLASEFVLEAEAWEETGCGQVCNCNNQILCNDRKLCSRAPGGIQPVGFNPAIGGSSFSLGQFPPGNNSSNMIEIWYCGGRYRVRLSVTYTMPDPAPIGISQNVPNTLPCGNGDLTLHTSVATGFLDQVNFAWSYRIFTGRMIPGEIPNPDYCGDQFQCVQDPIFPQELPGCCFEPPTIPGEVPEVFSGSLPSTNAAVDNGSQTVVLRSLPGFQNMTQKGTIFFSVWATANNSSSGPTFSNAQFLDPPAPLVTGAITPFESCNRVTGKNNGIIQVAGVVGLGSYRYNLRPGHNNNNPCDPLDPSNPCFSGTVSGSTSGVNFSILHVPAGDFTLWLANEGGDVGVCSSLYNVTVDELPALTLEAPAITNLTCHQQATGQLQIQYSGGKGPFDFTLSGQPPNQTGLFPGLSAGSYEATVKDQCLQLLTQPIEVKQPAKVNVQSTVISPATCVTPGNGQVAVSITETTGPYDVSSTTNFHFRILKGGALLQQVTTASTSFLSNNLAIGDDYEYFVTEENGLACNGSSGTFQIAAPPVLAVTAALLDSVRCAGGADGQLRLTGAGGSNLFRYELVRLSDNQTLNSPTGAFVNLREGNYRVVVFNNSPGCTDAFTAPNPFHMPEPAPLSANLDKFDISCTGAGDGKIDATVQGGTRPFQPGQPYGYFWEADFGFGFSSFQSGTNRLTDLDTGTYRVRIKDKNNCELISPSVKILEPQPLVINNITVSDIRCLGDTGSITINASGGTPGYVFETSADGGVSFQALTPLTAGSYRARVRDANNCTTADPGNYVITDPPSALTFTVQKRVYNGGFNISCFGGNNGEVTLLPAGGNGPGYSGYEFAVGTGPFGSNNVLTGLTLAAVPVKVRDDRGCEVSQIINDLTQAPAITTITSLKENVECFGASTGRLELGVTGGVGPFTYQLGTQPPQPQPLFQNLMAGNYSFAITDANGCALNYQDDIINLNPPLAVTPTLAHVRCFNTATGSIALAVSGGAAPYQYELAGNTVTNPVANLSAGSYRIAIIDNEGCRQETTDLLLTQPDELLITNVTRQDIVCFGETGSIALTATGGAGAYLFEYATGGNPFSSFTSSTPLNANTYNVRVRDGNDCIATHPNPVNITAPPAALDFSFTLSDYDGFNISCFGGDNGFANLLPTGGNGNTYSGYTFAVDGGPFQSAPVIDRLQAGNRSFSVRDDRGCIVSKSVVLTQATIPFTLSAVKEDVRCFNDLTGRITVSTSGGIAPYQFQLGSSPAQTGNQFGNLGVGDYTITALDKYACNATAAVSIVSLNPEIIATSTVQHVRCFGGQDGSVSLTVSGGMAPLSYAWAGQSATTSTLTSVRAGTYTATITDQAGCFIQRTATVNQPTAALQLGPATALAACYDQANGALTLNATGGTPPYRFSINSGTTYQPGNVFGALPAGVYNLKIEDANACNSTGNATIGQRNSRPEPNFLVASKNYALDTLVLTEIGIPKPDAVSWQFDPRAIIIDPNPAAPRIRFLEEGSYTISLTSFFGDCAYVTTKTIRLQPYDPNRKPDNLPGVRPIEQFSVTPNPTTGEFSVYVKLNKKRNLSLVVFDATGIRMFTQNFEDVQEVTLPGSLANAAAGLYIVRAITEAEAKEVRLIVNR